MSSTIAPEPFSAMNESLNWLEMPDELMTNILQRLDTKELLTSALKVCTTWRRICKDAAMWKIICMNKSFYHRETNYVLEILTKQAVDLSCGELIDISINYFGTNHLLNYITLRSSKLNRLDLYYCIDITGSGLCQAVKRVPQLEKLHLSYISIDTYDIIFIGQNCPQLKSLIILSEDFRQPVIANDYDALAIADNMPELRHLKLSENWMTNDGLQAIINGCPHLESLDIGDCYDLNLDRNFLKECTEWIKDFKCEVCSFDDNGFHYSDDDFDYYDSDCYKSDSG